MLFKSISFSGRLARIPITRRRLGVTGLTLAAGGLMTASAYLFRPATAGGLLLEAALLMLAGGLALWGATAWQGYAARETRESRRVEPLPSEPAARSRTPQIALGLGLAALLALVEINGNFAGLAALQNVSLRAQFGLLVAAVALITWGLGAEPGARVKAPVSRRAALALGLEVGALATITLLALFLRVWHLGDAVHKFVDEIHFSTAVAGLLPGTNEIDLLAPFAGITAFPWLYPFWQSEVVFVGGRTLESLRLVSAVLGALNIPALYLLARTLFDRTTALMAALLLASFPPHLHFSRIALNNIADPLFGTLALAFLARGLKTGRRMDYAVAGAALGLTQYFYEGGRLLFPPLAAAWVLLLAIMPRLTRRGRGDAIERRLNRRGLMTAALAAVLVGAPIYTTLLANDLPLMPRMGTVAVGGTYWQRVMTEGTPQTLEQHILRPFLVYVHMPETALFYGGDQPLVLEYLVPFLLLGVFGLLWRWRTPGNLILLWVLLTSMGNMLMTESAVFARYVVVFPALALLLALGVRYLLALLWPGRAALALLLALTAFMALRQGVYYFDRHLEFYNWQIRPTYDSEDAMFRSAGFPAGTQVHVISQGSYGAQYLSGVLGYLAENPGLSVDVVLPEDFNRAYLDGLPPEADHAFYLEPYDVRAIGLLQQQYGDLLDPRFSPYNVPPERQLVLFYIPGTPGG